MWADALEVGAEAQTLYTRLDTAERAAASQRSVDARIWAVDLSQGSGGSAPKFYVVASPVKFAAAYVRVAARHAYEVVEGVRGCHAFFDLDAAVSSPQAFEEARAAAGAVRVAAEAVLLELAALREPRAAPLEVDILALDGSRPLGDSGKAKVSFHLVCRCARDGAPWLLRGPHEAGVVAQHVRARLAGEGRSDAAAMIDCAVYGERRPFRLLGSSKLADARSRPFWPTGMAPSRPIAAADLLASLVSPMGQPQMLPPFLLAKATERGQARTAQATKRLRGGEAAPAPLARWWGHATACPLLDMPRLPHRALVARVSGGAHDVPEPLARLWTLASSLLGAQGGGRATRWRFERASAPIEMLFHVDGTQRGVCAHVGRCHKGHHVMVTCDLLNGIAWQRCWDRACTREVTGGYVKAKHSLGGIPEECMPPAAALEGLGRDCS